MEVLMSVSRTTFSDAFQDQNNPDDFASYLEKAFSKEQLTLELENPQTQFYFVYLEGKLVAYFKLNCGDAQTDVKQEDCTELERIYVLKAFQGRQLGNQIVQWIKDKVESDKKSFMWLGVWEKNPRAIAFYERHGFYKFGSHPYYIGNDKQTDWLMRYDF
ncbi:GNAT family N-acetyltransferase [Maribacter litopenaei]|uniref:GNAT family N-acetyltransferase n=1 Tax=Maribacter litopenaei TaxID=2976127 RepID=A0ABY5YAX7_9FLAO|nr:GNAT family N-acetyltransferase [Maribacter litopenaei]UWX55051.1 GNAT family N-acetyltransferase [Maribacter litopenaei]